MLTIASLVVALDIVGFVLVGLLASPSVSTGSHFDIGDVSLLVRVGSISGVVGSITVFTALILGLNREPGKKVGGVVVCLITLTILLIQAVTFVGVWARTG